MQSSGKINNTRYDHPGNQTGKNLGRIWPSYPQGKHESTILKESKFIQKDLQAPPLDFLMLPTSKTYWHDHVQAPNPRTSSFLDSHQLQAHPLVYSLSFNGSNWIDHQGVENISSMKTLSLCKGKLL